MWFQSKFRWQLFIYFYISCIYFPLSFAFVFKEFVLFDWIDLFSSASSSLHTDTEDVFDGLEKQMILLQRFSARTIHFDFPWFDIFNSAEIQVSWCSALHGFVRRMATTTSEMVDCRGLTNPFVMTAIAKSHNKFDFKMKTASVHRLTRKCIEYIHLL